MNPQNFKLLLEDLYSIYNPSRIREIDSIVSDNIGKEFDVLKMFYFKYNFRGNTKYNPKLGTDIHIKNLLQSYSNGERSLLSKNEQEEISEQEKNKIELKQTFDETKTAINNLTEENKKEIDNSIQNKLKNIDEYFLKKKGEIESKEKDLQELIQKNIGYIKEIEEKLNKLELPENIKPTIEPEIKNEKIELKITVNNNDESFVEFEVPKEINEMALGSRMIVLDSNGRICALEIKDIMYDFISIEGKCLKEITVERV